MEDRPLASLLANPTVWFGVQVVEFLVALWLVRVIGPGSWQAAVAILVVLVVVLTFVNLRLRRHFLTG